MGYPSAPTLLRIGGYLRLQSRVMLLLPTLQDAKAKKISRLHTVILSFMMLKPFPYDLNLGCIAYRK